MDAMAGQVALGVWPKTVQDFPSACDRATRSCASHEHRMDRPTVMQNPSAPNPASQPVEFCSKIWNSGWIGPRRCTIQQQARPGHRPLRADRASGWPDESDAEFFRIGRQPAGFLREVWDRDGSDPVVQDSAPSTAGPRDSLARIEDRDARIRALQNSASSAAGPPAPARVQLAPLPQGVGSLLGRAGEARSGFCREVKRRDAESSTNPSHRRLTSRQVPDCLRGPTEERTHTRNPTTPNPSPPRHASTPQNPALSPREGPRRRRNLETAAHPANATGGRVDSRTRRREAAAHTTTTTSPDRRPHRTNTQPIISSR